MAETLVELVARISADAAELKKGLSDAEKQTEKASANMAESLKQVGATMAASGAVITAAMGMMGKAALDEEINIKRLANTINNTGTAYDSVKDSLEAVIAATQRKTGVADDKQRDVLTRLLLVTNDYKTSLDLLPTVLDLAAAGQMDATTSATYLGKAYLDLQAGAKEVSVRFGQASLQFKSMEDIQNRVKGSAENLANPLDVLKASMGDVAEAIGVKLLPVIKPLIDQVVDIAIQIQDWTAQHPELTKVLAITTLALGVVMSVVGGLILILPGLIAGITAFGVVLGALTGPIGLVILGIVALIAAGVLIWKNWDTIKSKTIEIWNSIAGFFAGIWDTIVGLFWDNWDKILAILFPAIGLPILIARNWDAIVEVTRGIFGRMGDAIKDNFKGAVNAVVDMINNLLDYVARVRINFPGLSVMGKQIIPAFEWGLPPIPHIPRLASGGIVTQPTMAMVGEAGPEAVIPLNEGGLGGVTVNFSQPVFFDREDTMNKFVDMIRKGIQRQDRLRYGGAYNGA